MPRVNFNEISFSATQNERSELKIILYLNAKWAFYLYFCNNIFLINWLSSSSALICPSFGQLLSTTIIYICVMMGGGPCVLLSAIFWIYSSPFSSKSGILNDRNRMKFFTKEKSLIISQVKHERDAKRYPSDIFGLLSCCTHAFPEPGEPYLLPPLGPSSRKPIIDRPATWSDGVERFYHFHHIRPHTLHLEKLSLWRLL